MSERRGPVIEHDGKGYPKAIVRAAYEKGARRIVTWKIGDGRADTPWEQANPDKQDADHPGWTWGRTWLGKVKCSDPAYQRIVQYQFVYPGEAKAEKSEQVKMLREIAAGKREPADA